MKIEERTFLFPNGERAIIRSAGPEDGKGTGGWSDELTENYGYPR